MSVQRYSSFIDRRRHVLCCAVLCSVCCVRTFNMLQPFCCSTWVHIGRLSHGPVLFIHQPTPCTLILYKSLRRALPFHRRHHTDAIDDVVSVGAVKHICHIISQLTEVPTSDLLRSARSADYRNSTIIIIDEWQVHCVVSFITMSFVRRCRDRWQLASFQHVTQCSRQQTTPYWYRNRLSIKTHWTSLGPDIRSTVFTVTALMKFSA